jgi:hypothetical protein
MQLLNISVEIAGDANEDKEQRGTSWASVTRELRRLRHMRMEMQLATLLYTHCFPLKRTPSFSFADDPMTRCGALGFRGQMATPMRQGVCGVYCQWYAMLRATFIHNPATTT